MSYSVDYSDEWQHVEGVVDATYTSPDGATTYSKCKVRLGATAAGDYAGGIGGSVQTLSAIIWPLASDEGEAAVTTVEPQAKLTISGTTYRIVAVPYRRADGTQYKVHLQVHV